MGRKIDDLTLKELAQVKGMALRKDRQMDIALWFGVPTVSVHRVIHGFKAKWRVIEPAPLEDLPPKGPYQIVSRGDYERISQMASAPSDVLAKMVEMLSDIKGRIDAIDAAVTGHRHCAGDGEPS